MPNYNNVSNREKFVKKIVYVHSKKYLGRRQENPIFLFQNNFWSNLEKFLSETGKICANWTKSWSETVNRNFPLRTSEFSVGAPKIFLRVDTLFNGGVKIKMPKFIPLFNPEKNVRFFRQLRLK